MGSVVEGPDAGGVDAVVESVRKGWPFGNGGGNGGFEKIHGGELWRLRAVGPERCCNVVGTRGLACGGVSLGTECERRDGELVGRWLKVPEKLESRKES